MFKQLLNRVLILSKILQPYAYAMPIPFAFMNQGDAPEPPADNTTLLASQMYGYRPGSGSLFVTPTFTNSLFYIMAKGETHAFLLKINTDSTITLNCSGTVVTDGKLSCKFFKVGAYYPDNSDAFMRASISTSPANGTSPYWVKLGEIPSGSNNFTPEAASTDEYVLLDITVASSATAGDTDFTINAGSDSISPDFEVANFTMPDVPYRQTLMQLSENDISNARFGGSLGDNYKGFLLDEYGDVMKAHRVAIYKNSLAFLSDAGSTLNLDSGNGDGGSWRQQQLEKYSETGWLKNWFIAANNTTLADEAEGTVSAEAGIAGDDVWYYEDDEPSEGEAATIKSSLDHWDVNSPSTWILLTANADYDDTAGAISASLDFTDYTRLVLTPVINHVETGEATVITDYVNGKTGLYSSCQGNCQGTTNSNSTGGSDTGFVDMGGYIDYPSERARAWYWLGERSTWRDKVKWYLHYDSIQAHIQYDGVLITVTGDTAGSLDGDYFILDGENGSVCFWIDVDNGGGSAPGGSCASADAQEEITGITTGMTAANVRTQVQSEIDARAEFVSYANVSNSSRINVMGGIRGGSSDAGTTGFTLSHAATEDPWKSVRRFGIMGDGTFLLPRIGKPFVGLPMYASNDYKPEPLWTLKTLRDSSFESDALYIYHTREGGTPIADSLVTDADQFETDWGEYEYKRWQVYKANGAGNAITNHTLSSTKILITTQPTTGTEDEALDPIVVSVTNVFGAANTSDDTTEITASIASGTGSLSGTTAVTVTDGVATFSNLIIDSPDDDFTLEFTATGLTSATSDVFEVVEAGAAIPDASALTGTLLGYYSADDLANITKNGSNQVATWANKANPGTHNLTQATDANKPVWTDAFVNGKAALAFDQGGTAQWLGLGSWSGGGTKEPFVAIVVAKASSNTSTHTLFASNGGTNTYSAGIGQSDKLFYFDNQNNGGDAGSTAEDTNWHIFYLDFSGGFGRINKMRVDCGAAQLTEGSNDAEGYAKPQDFRLGVRNDGSTNPLIGYIAYVAIWSTSLDATEYANFCAELQTYYGL